MIHNIFGDDVNIYPVYLSRAIITWGNCLNWLEQTIVSDHIFCQFLTADLGTHSWLLSVYLNLWIYCICIVHLALSSYRHFLTLLQTEQTQIRQLL